MKLIQRIEIMTEVTEEELKHWDLDEYKQELFEHMKSEADENAIVRVDVIVEE